VVRFNEVGVWPVSVGHGCVGCTEPAFWDTMTPFYERLPGVNLPFAGGAVQGANSAGMKILGVTAAAVGIHAVVGIGKKVLGGGKDKTSEQA